VTHVIIEPTAAARFSRMQNSATFVISRISYLISKSSLSFRHRDDTALPVPRRQIQIVIARRSTAVAPWVRSSLITVTGNLVAGNAIMKLRAAIIGDEKLRWRRACRSGPLSGWSRTISTQAQTARRVEETRNTLLEGRVPVEAGRSETWFSRLAGALPRGPQEQFGATRPARQPEDSGMPVSEM